jgi:methyl-accepting chemotaxis protein
VWVIASYNPILDDGSKLFRVAVFASDITQQKLKTADLAGQIEAIGKSQAVIEFDMDGVILDANENFLKALGHTLSEIKGRHHSPFVAAADRDGPAYRELWAKLKRGEFRSGEYKRIGKAQRRRSGSRLPRRPRSNAWMLPTSRRSRCPVRADR